MRLIFITSLFLIPLIGFASFPIQISILSDTIIESKKETMEEYKIRIQKQLYSGDKKNLIKQKKIHAFNRFFIIIVGYALVMFIVIAIYALIIYNL